MKRCLQLLILLVLLVSFNPYHASANVDTTMQDEAVYMIMVDRFNNGDTSNDKDANLDDPYAYHGGDFKGIMDKLDYIKEMGFTAIWLTPIFENTPKGYHGYWTKDYYKTNEYFGTMEEFKALVQEAHERDLKIILDFVVNHVGPNHEWLNDPSKEEWFHPNQPISNWNDQAEVENGWLYDLPDLNQSNPEVAAYLIEAAKWWIKETDIDGYRLDTVKHVPKEYWFDFSSAIKAEKENFYLIGEVWHDNPNVIAEYEETGIDGFFDFSQNDSLRTAFEKSNQSLGWLFSNVERNEKLFNRSNFLGQFIDNHDMTRFSNLVLNQKEEPKSQLKKSLTYLYTAPGIPIIYYGTEIAMDGGNDPDNRRMMQFDSENNLVDYISKLGSLRTEHLSLTRGKMEVLHEDEGIAIYSRVYEEETIVVAINNTSEQQRVVLEGKLENGKRLMSLLSDSVIKSNGNQYTINIESGQSEIYELTEKADTNWLFIVLSSAVLGSFILILTLGIREVKKRSVF
ncbi:alpha-glucosidase C-terminal domain-containing protein [Psychrobacillus sp. Sa2BUA9]|uniref:alpha-amylase n=1 Tax=Psychrobacillus faecigallinarum TaxID=2762235 RepID=A0ABR8R9L6_9BACI|nr:alpha-glucosidase C-terminal domain-containing protein [Psychrobacillus faecigallinarum]